MNHKDNAGFTRGVDACDHALPLWAGDTATGPSFWCKKCGSLNLGHGWVAVGSLGVTVPEELKDNRCGCNHWMKLKCPSLNCPWQGKRPLDTRGVKTVDGRP